jgi:predicted ATPase
LDNCEHLVAGVAALAEKLLAACPELHVLTTSREPLAVTGEVLWPVPPLSVPTPDVQDPRELLGSEAVRLFEDRAVKAQPSFAITSESAPIVAALCRNLDGLPLAIEPARQQTLRATLDWSYNLLDSGEQLAFEQSSVFSGGCSLEAARFVIGRAGLEPDEVLDLLKQPSRGSNMPSIGPGTDGSAKTTTTFDPRSMRRGGLRSGERAAAGERSVAVLGNRRPTW